jgi:hypothetical protein
MKGELTMEGRFLPIGSVVRLKEGKKRLMITGFLPIEQNEKGEKNVWDYSACLYPEGVITPTNNYLFNHSQIEEIHFIGLVDEEEEKFKEKLNKAVEELGNK